MSQASQLIDWIYSNTMGALVVFPMNINRWNAAALIASELSFYKILVVTKHPVEFNKAITDKLSNHWTELQIVQFPTVDYENIDTIRNYINNIETDLIIFDDATMLGTILQHLTLNNKHMRIIILTSWGDSYSDLDHITDAIDNASKNIPKNYNMESNSLGLASLNILKSSYGINWNTCKVPMSERQLKFYNHIRRNEILTNDPDYQLSKATTLYVYPDFIMVESLLQASTCQADQTQYPDIDTEYNTSWLTESYIENVNENGPKLLAILDGVISEWPKKQIILTMFNHRFGVDLIYQFLKMLAGDKSPYDVQELVHISCSDDKQTIKNMLNDFNSLESGILITNIVPTISLINVSKIHVADSYSIKQFIGLLDACFKKNINGDDIDVTLYQSTFPDTSTVNVEEQTSDETLHETFVATIDEYNKLYIGLQEAGNKIVYDTKSLSLIVL